MNMAMKKVTSWAAIIAVPTAITGFYGQNLPYPGFASALGLLVLLGADRRDLAQPVLVVSPSRLAVARALALALTSGAARVRCDHGLLVQCP